MSSIRQSGGDIWMLDGFEIEIEIEIRNANGLKNHGLH